MASPILGIDGGKSGNITEMCAYELTRDTFEFAYNVVADDALWDAAYSEYAEVCRKEVTPYPATGPQSQPDQVAELLNDLLDVPFYFPYVTTTPEIPLSRGGGGSSGGFDGSLLVGIGGRGSIFPLPGADGPFSRTYDRVVTTELPPPVDVSPVPIPAPVFLLIAGLLALAAARHLQSR